MKLTDERNESIFKALATLNIHASKWSEGTIQVNRTECHNAIRVHEWDIIRTLDELVKAAAGEGFYVCNGIKTDDVWTWEIYERN